MLGIISRPWSFSWPGNHSEHFFLKKSVCERGYIIPRNKIHVTFVCLPSYSPNWLL